MLVLMRIFGSVLLIGWSLMLYAEDSKGIKLVNDRPRNLNLVKELNKLCEANKKAKKNLKQATSSNVTEKKATVRKVNEMNSTQFINVLKTSGWPSYESIGGSGIECVLLLVQETEDKNLRAQSLPYIMNYYYIGALSGQKFALYLDRYFLRTIGYQLFGSHVNIQNQKVVFQPILDKRNVNNKRDMMGLIGIESYQAKIEKVYQDNQFNINPLIQPDLTD